MHYFVSFMEICTHFVWYVHWLRIGLPLGIDALLHKYGAAQSKIYSRIIEDFSSYGRICQPYYSCNMDGLCPQTPR